MRDWLRSQLRRRPWWMNALMIFSAYMAVVYVPWDLFVKPVAGDEEVWFGIRFHDWAAKLLAVPHWAIYALGAYGFWKMRPWMWPWAAAYGAQVVVAMVVWPLLYGPGGVGSIVASAVSGLAFGAITLGLWRAKDLFQTRDRLTERYGEWAVVTGASAGIGAEFARAFAADGVCCVLAARREEKLRDLASELESRHGVKTRVVAVDLASVEGPDALVSAVSDLEIGILVNNAGFGYAGRFDKQETDRLREMVALNCNAPVVLTSRLLPAMVGRGRGAVIQVGSVAGSQPLPLHGVYSATKSFDNFLGESLWGELRGTGVDCLSLLPGSTESEFHGVAGELPHPGEPAADVVRTALDALGHQPAVVSGWFNWLRSNAAYRLLPRSWIAIIAKKVTGTQTPDAMR